jgi:hypothetical protein
MYILYRDTGFPDVDSLLIGRSCLLAQCNNPHCPKIATHAVVVATTHERNKPGNIPVVHVKEATEVTAPC